MMFCKFSANHLLDKFLFVLHKYTKDNGYNEDVGIY